SLRQIGDAIRGRFIVEELENWAADYDRTLLEWFRNFEAHWEKLRTKYSERFYRMWKFYLLASAGSFRSRRLQVWQILMSPVGFAGRSAPPAPADYARMNAARMNISGI
ncbi:MAG: class I SAM-dependent methyltransferase, partial [Candidatus Acidiferrales bacterium]